jgi:hypothetical protein
MCGMPQLEEGLTKCQFCDYEEKPVSELTKKQIHDLMGAYEYEIAEDGGYIIKTVKNIRDISLRGSVCIPHFVTEIADEAFSCCKFLASVELPKNIRKIGNYAFAHCRDLFDCFIPESVEYVGKGVFENDYSMRVVRCAAPEKPDGWDEEWLTGCDAKVKWSSIYND